MSWTEHQPSRRAFLRSSTALGASAWLGAGCSRRKEIVGEFAGPSVARGHQLLEPEDTRPSTVSSVSVAILGGGIAGLSAAWRLARAGFHDYQLYELEERIGGTSLGGENAISAYPWGAHYLPVPHVSQRAVCELLRELQILEGFDAQGRAKVLETALVRAPETRLYSMGSWTEGLYCIDGASADDLAQWRRFEQRMREYAQRRDAQGRAWFCLPLAHCSEDPAALALDNLTMSQWLSAEGFDSPRLVWMVEYACRDDYGCTHHETSAWAGIFYFAAREQAGGAEHSAFLTWPEGNAYLAKGLAQVSQGKIHSSCLVRKLLPERDRVRVQLSTPQRIELISEQVICALPRFVVQRVLSGLEHERGLFRYSPWVTANLSLHRAPPSRGCPQAWDNVLYESDSLGYVVATHQSDRAELSQVWTWYKPLVDSDPSLARRKLLESRWEDWRTEIIRDLSHAHPDLDRYLQRIDVWRWAHAMVRPEPGFRTHPLRRQAGQPQGRVHFAHTDLSGIALFEEAQWHGVRAAEEVLRARAIAFDPWI